MRFTSLLLGASLTAIAAPAAAQTTTTREGTTSTVTVTTATPAPAQAAPQPTTTLRDALAQTYATNPDLQGERATLRANDENVPIARSQGLPGVGSSSSFSQSVYDTDSSGLAPSRRGSVGLDLSVPVFSGGSVRNSVRAAETRVEAGRANLRGAEADIFTQAVTGQPAWAQIAE